MKEKHKSSAAWLLFPFAILAALLATYIVGYFQLGVRSETFPMWQVGAPPPTRMESVTRYYPYPWQAFVFHPAAQVESLVREYPVRTSHRDLRGFSR